ncbi:anti-sigma factor family protein [Oceanibaculum indicum]|uniref:Anti-sigma factor RsiW n=1 Tax=Oceanibaculum indicum TaxID=526216 RepID=A0A420WNX0_9PROT|nr:hypothetical protein [Oceanibaculum indicum]RKQ72566.1 hypothetical protein BCL74_0334 [Oceanibaculum indicum]
MKQADWEVLNAYVDGELDAASRADMAGRIAADPGFAATVAEISRLKAGVRAALQPDAVLPAASLRRLDGAINQRRRLNRVRAIAAVAAMLVLVLGGAFLLGERAGNDQVAGWVEEATELHLAWVNGEKDVNFLLDANDTMVNRSGVWTPIPDLHAARLSLARVVVSPSGSKAGLFAGYRGTRGCQVGLWIGGVPETLAETVQDFSSRDVARYAWRVGDTGYAVVALGMDSQRLSDIVAHIERWSRQSAATRLAGREIHDAPCLG